MSKETGFSHPHKVPVLIWEFALSVDTCSCLGLPWLYQTKKGRAQRGESQPWNFYLRHNSNVTAPAWCSWLSEDDRRRDTSTLFSATETHPVGYEQGFNRHRLVSALHELRRWVSPQRLTPAPQPRGSVHTVPDIHLNPATTSLH